MLLTYTCVSQTLDSGANHHVHSIKRSQLVAALCLHGHKFSLACPHYTPPSAAIGALLCSHILSCISRFESARRRELLALGLSGSATTPPPPLFIPLSDAPTASAGSTALPPALVCVTGWCVAAPGQGVMEVVASRAAGMRTREWPLPQGAGCGASEAQLGECTVRCL